MTKERPIIFSAEMVRAILRGEKTQTRRVIKPQFDDEAPLDMGGWWIVGHPARDIRCPYGQPAHIERLWVKETWRVATPDEDINGVAYRADFVSNPHDAAAVAWKSPRFMPRWASRLTLEITDVRVERLQEISEADAIAEGFAKPDAIDAGKWLNGSICVDRFARKWDQLNGDRGFGWDVNPWVWVVAFQRTTDP